jgi:hypothetical protein
MTERSTLNDPILALCEYFLNARVMHDLTHEMRSTLFESTEEERSDLWVEFRTYYSYWLSGLFVVAEGFQTLGLKSPKIEKLIVEHIDQLRLFRNATFHFQKTPAKRVQFHDGKAIRLNWAEELHDVFEKYFRRQLNKHIRASSSGRNRVVPNAPVKAQRQPSATSRSSPSGSTR